MSAFLLIVACTPLGAEPPGSVQDRLTMEGVTVERQHDGVTERAEAEQVVLREGGALEASTISLESPKLEIDAAQARWFLQDRRAEFSQDVVAKRGEWRLECERLTVELDDMHRVVRAHAEGAVRAHRAPWTSGANEAVLEVQTGLLTMTGSPWVSSPRGRMEGERIIMAWDRDELECQGCKLSFALPDLPALSVP